MMQKQFLSEVRTSETRLSVCCVRTSAAPYISLALDSEENCRISGRELANSLTKVIYFPEAQGGHFSAAQYACELAAILKREGPLVQLHALLTNSHEAFLGYTPPVAKAAEKALRGDRYAINWRDRLEEQYRARIFVALSVPNFDRLQTKVDIAIGWAREQLDVTLERDIGAFIYREREAMAPPLPRIIKPMTPWTRPAEKYLQLYQDLTALCGLPAKE